MKFLLLVILIVVGGIYAAIEMSLFAINEYELEGLVEKKNKKAISLNNLLKDKTKLLVTINLIIVICNMLASAIASEDLVNFIMDKVSNINISASILSPVVVMFVAILLASITLIFGTIIPKQIGLSSAKKIAYKYVNLLSASMVIFEPLIFLFNTIAKLVLRIFGIKVKKVVPTETGITEEVRVASNSGRIDSFEKNTILKTFTFNSKKVLDVMTKMEDVRCIDYYSTYNDVMNEVKINKYTRFPVKKDGEIIGVLNVKELLGRKTFPKRCINKPLYINPNTSLEEAFKKLKKGNNMAIVKNRKVLGLVTIEDVIEEITGDITDEYDR